MLFERNNWNVSFQEKCEDAMKLWGYNALSKDENLETFQPVRDLEHFKLTAAAG